MSRYGSDDVTYCQASMPWTDRGQASKVYPWYKLILFTVLPRDYSLGCALGLNIQPKVSFSSLKPRAQSALLSYKHLKEIAMYLKIYKLFSFLYSSDNEFFRISPSILRGKI